MYLNPKHDHSHHKQVFQKIVAAFHEKGKQIHCQAGDTILKSGEPADYLFYVQSGIIRAYRWINDREVNIGFTFSGDIDSCPVSLLQDVPSTDTLEAITAAQVLRLPKKEFMAVLAEESDQSHLIAHLLTTYLDILLHRYIELKAFTAEELYLKLIERQAAEVPHIPLKHIASYLGISQERLSRIRKKLDLT